VGTTPAVKSDPEALRALKMKVKRLKARPEVTNALAALDAENNRPKIEPLRNAVMVAGYCCRVTIGTLVLLEAAEAAIVSARHGEELTDMDIAEAVFLLCDEYRDEALSAAGDTALLAMYTGKVLKGWTRRDVRVAGETLELWFADIADAFGMRIDAQAGAQRPGGRDVNWWSAAADMLLYEYGGYTLDFVLWRLPLSMADAQIKRIIERRTGKRRPTGGGEKAIALLDALYEADAADKKEQKQGTEGRRRGV